MPSRQLPHARRHDRDHHAITAVAHESGPYRAPALRRPVEPHRTEDVRAVDADPITVLVRVPAGSTTPDGTGGVC